MRTGWGPNDRAWWDDEFWMDVLVQGVGWLLVAASIGISAFFFYRQRQNEIADRRNDAERARIARSLPSIEETLGQLNDVVHSLETKRPRSVDDAKAAIKHVRALTVAMVSVCIKVPNLDVAEFLVDMTASRLLGYLNAMTALVQAAEEAGKHNPTPCGELSKADWHEIDLLGDALRKVVLRTNASVGHYESNGVFLDVVSWDEAVALARQAQREAA